MSHKTVHIAHTNQNAQTHKICTFKCQLPQNISRSLFICTEAASHSVYQRLYLSVRRPGRGAECFGISSVHAGLTFILHINSSLKLWCLVTGTTNWGLLPGWKAWRDCMLFPNYRTQKAKNSEISPVVTICTTSLTFNNSPFRPHSVFMCFVWIWEQTAIISLYSINWLVCIAETESVYCAVRTGSLNIICVKLRL